MCILQIRIGVDREIPLSDTANTTCFPRNLFFYKSKLEALILRYSQWINGIHSMLVAVRFLLGNCRCSSSKRGNIRCSKRSLGKLSEAMKSPADPNVRSCFHDLVWLLSTRLKIAALDIRGWDRLVFVLCASRGGLPVALWIARLNMTLWPQTPFS